MPILHECEIRPHPKGVEVANFVSLKKLTSIFGGTQLVETVTALENSGEIPASRRFLSGALFKKGWPISEVPLIGEKIGYFKKFSEPVALSVFTTKGGVLKSTLALNIARTAALHGLKTCVVGLDIQGDVTTALGYDNQLDEEEDLQSILNKLNSIKGLSDYFNNRYRLHEVIEQTDIPNLFLIPETPELAALNDSLSNINRREYWLRDKVITPLKEHFDLIIMDCSPNWNKLTTNALVACDILVSPLECKINNFRNFKVFKHFLQQFRSDMGIEFSTFFIPTKFNPNRRLGQDICKWYQQNVPNCSVQTVKESIIGEEATALNISVIEHAAGKVQGKEMISLMKELHQAVEVALKARSASNRFEPRNDLNNSARV